MSDTIKTTGTPKSFHTNLNAEMSTLVHVVLKQKIRLPMLHQWAVPDKNILGNAPKIKVLSEEH